MNLEELSFLRITEGFLIKPFDCEDDDLNEFLFEEAILYSLLVFLYNIL